MENERLIKCWKELLNDEVRKMHPHDIITQLNTLTDDEKRNF